MKVLGQEVLILSILLMLVISCCSSALSMQMAIATKSHSNGTRLSITLVRGTTQIGPVNISANDTVVASNIDVTKKSSSVIPITIPDKLVSGTIRICATAVAPAATQICTDVQNMKNKVTLDLTKAIAG
jgi:hypothetical protein